MSYRCVCGPIISAAHQAFIFDHLEGEAREEITYRPRAERGDPARILAILRVVWLCTVVCYLAAGLFLPEATGRRDVAGVLRL